MDFYKTKRNEKELSCSDNLYRSSDRLYIIQPLLTTLNSRFEAVTPRRKAVIDVLFVVDDSYD